MNWFDLLTQHLAGPVGYAGVLLLLTVCGLGVPVPEDIILISGGYIAANADAGTGQHKAMWLMMLIGLAGIVVGDSIIYGLGRRLGPPIARRPPLNRVLTPERLVRVEKLFHKYGQHILMAARFMPGVRAVAFFSAGTTGVPYYKFIAFDGSAALISAPFWVFLGYRFSDNITMLFEKAKHAQHWLFGTLFALIGVFIVERYVAHRRTRERDKNERDKRRVALDLVEETPKAPEPELERRAARG